MIFRNFARLRSAGARSAAISVVRAGLSFEGNSKGGDATVETLRRDSYLYFFDKASAQNMVIANRFGNVNFRNRSTGGDAELVNHSAGRSYFYSVGPQRDGIVTMGAIRNDGLLLIGYDTSLVVRRDLVLDLFAQASVRVEVLGTRVGSLVVRGDTRLGGDLIVHALNFGRPVPGHHRLITTQGALTGRFRSHNFEGFPENLRPRIVYSGKQVNLIVERR
jgi:hypothetical protein